MTQRKVQVYRISSISLPSLTLKSFFSTRTLSISDLSKPDSSPVHPSDLHIGAKVNVYLTLTDKLISAVLAQDGEGGAVSPPGLAVGSRDEEAGKRAEAARKVGGIKVMQKKRNEKPEYVSSLRAEFQNSVMVYSHRIFPIHLLKEQYRYSEDVKAALRLIQSKCPAFRKCNAGDQLSSWTALSLAYTELLSRNSTPIERLRQYFSLISTQTHDAHYETVCHVLTSLETQKMRANPTGAAWMEDESIRKHTQFWRSSGLVLKRCAESYLKTGENSMKLLQLPSESVLLLLSSEEDGQMNIGYSVLAIVLRLKLIVLSSELHNRKQIYEGEQGQELMKLYLFRDNVVFHLLYSQGQLDADGYDLQTGKYRHGANASIDRLIATRKEKVPIESRMDNEIALSKLSIWKYANTYVSLQELITDVLSTLQTTDNRLISEVADQTLEMIRARNYQQSVAEVAFHQITITDGAREAADRLRIAMRFDGLTRLIKAGEVYKSLKICEFCEDKRAVVFLECRHIFCRDCVSNYLEDKTKQFTYLLTPTGKAITSLRCLSLHCDSQFSTNSLRNFLGEQKFKEMEATVKREIGSSPCPKCLKLRPVDSLLALCLSCHSPICKICHITSYRLSERTCQCGAECTQLMLEQMRHLTLDCSKCKLSLSGTEFSSVECSDHILCQNCLVRCADLTKKCGTCGRPFQDEELRAIDEFKELLCDECWEECRFHRIKTNCKCQLCEKCAVSMSVTMKQTAKCFKCQTPFPYSTTRFLNEKPRKPAFVCDSCGTLDESQEMATHLPCNHHFHRACIRKNLELSISSTHSIGMAICPVSDCGKQFSPQETKEIVEISSLFNSINNTDSFKCPKCGKDADRALNESDPKVRRCASCEYQFCFDCRYEFIQYLHDPAVCEFHYTQRLVKFAEAENREDVTQCPNCKHPFVGSSTCRGTVTCNEDKCKTQFCFKCAADAKGYFAHGNAWHRPSCEMYKRDDRRRVGFEECDKCARLGRECSPPKDLRVPRRFEYQDE